MNSQKIPSRRLKVKAKEAEPKFCTYFPTQRCCSISVWVWQVVEVKEVRRGFPHFSFVFSQWCGEPMKKCCYTWGTQELSQALWYSIPASLRAFLFFWNEYKAMRAFEWDKGYSETSCVQVITNSLYHHACILEQFTYPGKSQCCILTLNSEIDCFDRSSRDSKQQELIKHTCDVRLTSITISFLLLTII